MRRRMKLVSLCALTATFLAISIAPANAQLQNLLDLLIPPKPTPAPVAPPAAPGPASSAPNPSTPTTSKPNPAAAGKVPFPLAVPQIRRSPARSTAALFETLKTLTQKGLSADKAILKVAAPFPVAGPAKFSHDWGFPRYNPTPHLHQGTDIFAAFGTPIVASESGKILKKGSTGAGGISVWITSDSGTGYYYAHMQSWVKGLTAGQRVEKGSIIGFVGNSGNAAGTPPHVHFQIHPPGRGGPGGPGTPARDPKPFLDDALRQAENNALILARGASPIAPGGKRSPATALLVATKKADKLLQAAPLERPEDLMLYSLQDPTLGVLALARQSAAAVSVAGGALTDAELKEETRMDEVRSAVAAPGAKIKAFVNSNLLKEEAVVVGPVGLALIGSREDPGD